MSDYVPTIGLEIHAELKTQTKMFCCSKNDPNEKRPNVNICPVCLAHPGTLPVINREAVKHVLRVGVALGAKLADYTEFDRKNYFYPDLPKGYQISQFEYPLVVGGALGGVAVTRVHLEEDTASSIHGSTSLTAGDDSSGATLIDYNRSGVPLMELVTEPVMHSAEEAGAFARELQLLLRYLGASEANMEKGEMRVEANVSVAKAGTRSAAYVEIKNLNSFRTMERAVAYEIERQKTLIERGGTLEKQTLGWDEDRQQTFPQRSKEGSADYRYFPDPDLPALMLSEVEDFQEIKLKESMPELPAERRERYVALGIKKEDAELYVRDSVFGDFFDAVVGLLDGDIEQVKLASNYIANDLVKIIRDTEIPDSVIQAEINISAQDFRKIIELLASKKISSRSGKDLLRMCVQGKGDPETLAKEQGLLQELRPEKLAEVVAGIVAGHGAVVADYRAGKASAMEFLVGQGMKALRGAGDPQVLREALRAAIDA